jgi:DNA topoisomerase-1
VTESLAKRAKQHGLRTVNPSDLNLERRKSGRGFVYLDGKGRLIRDRKLIDRINALAIPPAWTEVRIAQDPAAHIQAIGRDNEGRLQYRYHPDWTAVRDQVKAERLQRFGTALPKIRASVEKDLARRKTDQRYAAAAAVRLIDLALLRSGHGTEPGESGRGVATLLKRDVKLNGTKVFLNFTGKSGKQIRKTIRDPRLPARLRKLKRIGKKRLFAFHDEGGNCCYLTARDLNTYLRQAAGAAVTAKDFRTFAASAHALALLCQADCPPTDRGRKSIIAGVMRETSEKLANTPAVTRSSYVHPLVVDAFERERIDAAWLKGRTRNGLDSSEQALLRFFAETLPATGAPGRNDARGRGVTATGNREEKRTWPRRRSKPSGRSSRTPTSA